MKIACIVRLFKKLNESASQISSLSIRYAQYDKLIKINHGTDKVRTIENTWEIIHSRIYRKFALNTSNHHALVIFRRSRLVADWLPLHVCRNPAQFQSVKTTQKKTIKATIKNFEIDYSRKYSKEQLRVY